ncbi:7TM receptor with intracellular HD hydrolase [Clostridiales bacterium oral taxon 876 str. F0540]|nr:7TM receptor with intracellular HD hydrolase [Clostridiales bacterium oral taxon 876 str. F0540]
MGTINLRGFLADNKVKHILIYLCTFLIIYFTLITSLSTKTYDIKEGEIAKVSIRAQRNTIDEAATSARKKEAVSLVPPQYTVKTDVKDNAINTITTLFVKVTQVNESNIDIKEKTLQVANSSNIGLSEEDITNLIKMNSVNMVNLKNFLIDTMNDVYDLSIQFNPNLSAEVNNENLKKAQDIVQMNFNRSKFDKATRDLGTAIGVRLVKHNSFFDKEKTEEMKNNAINNTPPVVIKKDQIIVMEGEQITPEKYATLKSLGLINTNTKSEWYIYISLGVLIALVLFIESFYIYKYQNDIYKDWSKFLLVNIINCISLILARVLGMVSPFLIPFAFAPILLTLLLNYKVSLTVGVINAVFISGALNFNSDILILAILNAVVGALVIQKLQQRNDILFSCLYIAVMNVITTLSIGFLLSNNIKDNLTRAGFSIVGSGLAGILTIGVLPAFESVFDIVTNIKLLELSNPNNPLLKKLLLEAPGTYHHSILVANLAEVAAEAIGGNPVLARVCSYYHDVGKIKRPYFFKENQIGNDNPHNKITANLSALIIISHVKDGLELAKEYRLPQIIHDIIEQHHGNSLVKYFYVTAKNKSENPEEILEDDFRYQGRNPISKEAGIIMLADSVEAAVRSISEPTQTKIEEMVNNIIKSKLNEGQLDNCNITLKDLNEIKEAFLKALTGIYHQRIEYPTDKWNITHDKTVEVKL